MLKVILIAWELGGGLGHVTRAAAFARSFAEHGARVAVALGDLADASLVCWPEGVVLLQAPVGRRLPLNFANPSSYGELLYGCGYHDGNQLSALVTGWCQLIDLIDPSVILADHAPSAQLAARISGIPVARVGSGFFAPPPVAPTPRFRTWEAVEERRMIAAEHRVLQIINAVLEAGGARSAPSLSAALTPDQELLVGWSELDCYADLRPPGSVTYIGNEHHGANGIAPVWPLPAAGRKKIAAYLKGDYGALQSILRALDAQYATIAYVTQLDEAARRRLQSDHLRLSPAPLDITQLAQECDALVCHAGAGTAPLFLEAGKPLVLLPQQAEQRINADQIAQTGAGLRVDPNDVDPLFGDALEKVSGEARYTAAARLISLRWAGGADAVTAATHEILGLIGCG